MNFSKNQELALFREKAAAFLASNVVPFVDDWERQKHIPLQELLTKMYQAQLLGCRYTKEKGGYGLTFNHHYILAEELGKVPCGAFGMAVTIQQDMTTPLVVTWAQPDLGVALVKEFVSGKKVLAHAVSEKSAGSDLSGIQCKAIRREDHYLLTGEKWMVSLAGCATHFIVLARTDETKTFPWGFTLFLVDKSWSGVTVQNRKDLMGHRALDVHDVSFLEVIIPETHRLGADGFGYILQARQFEEERILASARANGMAMEMMNLGVNRALNRKSFGKSLFEHQSMRFQIARFRANWELSRALSDKACKEFVETGATGVLSAACKYISCRLVRETADELIRIYGAAGYEEQSIPSRWFRDARLLSISTGSEEVMLQALFDLVGRKNVSSDNFENEFREFLDNLIGEDLVAWRAQTSEGIRRIVNMMGSRGFLYRESMHKSKKIKLYRIHEILGEYPGGSLGLAVATHLDIATSIIEKFGTNEIKNRWLEGAYSGELILALALSEYSGGSDLASITTTYEKTENGWVINGCKSYVSNGPFASGVIVLAKDKFNGSRYSLFLIPIHTSGVKVVEVEMMGNPSTTASIEFNDVSVEIYSLLGAEGQGLLIQVMQLSVERMIIAIRAVAISRRMLSEIRDHLDIRKMYGKRQSELQSLQHRLSELEARFYSLHALVEQCRNSQSSGEDFVKQATVAKLEAGNLSKSIADFGLQITGGIGYLKDHPRSWDFLDCRALSIAGGTDEMMLETISNYELTRK